MTYSFFLPRRVSQGGCVVAGNKLAPRYEKLKQELKEEKTKLVPKVDSALHAILDQTKLVEALTSTDATMTDIDRGSDRCIAAMQSELDAIERVFDHAVLVPLTDVQAARLADARAVRGALLPMGTGFLKLVYTQQWVHMNQMGKALETEDVSSAVERLGMTPEADRLKSWIGLYGAKLGVTETKDADPAAVTIEAWHEAYGELFVHVHSEYGSTKDPVHARIRAALLGPYEEQAEEERRADAKTRGKRPSAEQEASPEVKKP